MAGTGQDPNGGPGNGGGQDPTQQPTPPVQDPPGQQQPGQQDPGQQQQTGGQPDPSQQTDWRDRRIGEQQQRLRERNARIAELEAQLAQRNGQPAPQPGQGNGAGQPTFQQPPVPQGGDIQRQINEAASRLASAQEFNRRCNEVAEAGRRVYSNFDSRVQRLVGLVDNNDQQQVQQYNAFLNAAMETGDATRLIYDLGGDLNEASRIMSLDPVKMAVELTKMSGRVSTTDPSQTPRPLVPAASLAQNNRVSIAPDDPDNSDSLSTEEWMARRNEQVNSRRQRVLG